MSKKILVVGGLLLVLADEHALAQRQTVRLDDHRVLALGLDVRHDLGRVIKRLILRGGDAVFLHQVLGEHLGGLDAGSSLVRAKGRDAGLCQLVHHAQGQRVILRHHDVIKFFLNGKAHHGLHIGGLDVLALGVVADAAVAGGTPDLAAVGALFRALIMACSRPPPPTTRIFLLIFTPSLSDGTAAGRRRPWRCRTCCRYQ